MPILRISPIGGLALAALTGRALLIGVVPTAGAAPASVRPTHNHRDIHSGVQRSLNWSGYIKPGAAGAYHTTTASWTVPTLKTTYNGYSSTWVGIDGASSGDQYLIQTGTEADVVRHRARYDAWWEVITPTNVAPETVFTNVTVHHGDSITASVTNNGNGRWTMTLRNNTTGVTGTHTSGFAGPGKSAEWVQEDTDVNGYISQAPNWQKVSFHNITVNGASPNLQYSQSVDIVDSHGTKEDNTAAPSANNAFTITWLAPGTRTFIG